MTPRDRFLQLLREDVLQLDLAELDFGIYRLLNHRRRQIEDFLSVELPAHIDSALAALPGEAGEDEQARIFNALYTFFNRYYDDGDFMPRARRGRDAAYSVPYNGEDVHFHWATKGSHYVKSGERFSGYAYTDGARRVTLGLRRADTEKDNVKGAKRCYVPAEFTVTEGGAALRFDYRPLDARESKRYDPKKKAAAAEAAAAAAPDDNGSGEPAEGKTPQDRLLNAWLAGNDFAAAAVPAGLDIERLGKHVRRYVKGQTTDFFVHPQLGSFLRGELDYFLKHEFVNLWDLPDAALARERGKHRIVKDLGERIIDVLAALEDVQAILFEKRKFVIGCDWLIRASALAAQPGGQALLDQACGNAAQVAEWARWVGEAEPAGDITAAGRDLLARFPHLPVHSRHLDAESRYRLLSNVQDLHTATAGTLVHSENFAGLRTVEPAHRQSVKCLYIDPPYNTGSDGFIYKDDFSRHASWLSLMAGRFAVADKMLPPESAVLVSLDENEVDRLRLLLDSLWGPECLVARVIWKKRSTPPNDKPIGAAHEYILVAAPNPGGVGLSLRRRDENRRLRFSNPDNHPKGPWAPGDLMANVKGGRFVESLRYPIRNPNTGEDHWPGAEGNWRFNRERIAKLVANDEISFGRDGRGRPKLKRFLDDVKGGISYTSIWDFVPLNTAGSREMNDLLGQATAFENPKPVGLIEEVARLGLTTASQTVLDFFAGSGTTGHAVINLNREDGGERRFTLIEQGEYFDTVLLPRIAKVITCPEWKDGRPKAGVSMQPAAGEDPDAHWSARTPALVKILRLERYEDALDALELPAEAEARAAGQQSLGLDRELIRYLVQTTAAGTTVRLATEKLAAPFDYRLPYTQAGQHTTVAVDLVETAHLLLGLHPVRYRRLTDAPTGTAVLVEVRPHDAAADVRELMFWRTVDESLNGSALKARMEAERDWLAQSVRAHFGRELGAYSRVRYNRDALLPPGVTGESIDAALAQAMLERA